jgi:hypothetical protein
LNVVYPVIAAALTLLYRRERWPGTNSDEIQPSHYHVSERRNEQCNNE